MPVMRLLPLLAVAAALAIVPAAQAQAPERVSNASLLLDRGVFRPLPDVPGAAVTTHLRNNNRGQVVGSYSDGTPRLRGFLMHGRRVTRIDVPGATATLPLGINDRGQILIAAAGTTDGTTCPPEGGTS
jgi:hypothetical protein